jgi:endonuclease/exonuclease/phosphatase family metal-dependent hydrolase
LDVVRDFIPAALYPSQLTLRSIHLFKSNTPFEPSKFPGAGSFRICTVAHLQLKTGDHTNFTFLNTHMDDQSDAQRRLAASLILYRARFEAGTTNKPVLVTGDFNRWDMFRLFLLSSSSSHSFFMLSPPTGADSGAYNIFTGVTPPVAINATFAAKYAVAPQSPAFSMLDLRAEAPRRVVRSTFATFTGFTAPSITSSWQRIDFVFGGTNGGWCVSSLCGCTRHDI